MISQKILAWSICLLTSFTLLALAQDGDLPDDLVTTDSLPEYVEGEILIKYKEGVSSQTVQASLHSLGIQTVKKYDRLGLEKCSVGENQTVEDAINALADNTNLEYAEPNYIVRILDTDPNDSSYGSQWALNNTGQTGGTADADIDAPQAWDISTGSQTVVVGVIDTGIDDGHPDLAANMWRNPGESGNGKENNGVDDDGNGFVDDYRGWDFANEDNNPFDDNEHGTHVAGIIGAVGNNNRGVSGINWSVSLVGLKFLTANGSGSTADAIEAILYAVDMGIPILNNSWGGGGFSQALSDAISASNQAGILFVAAAGNESNNNDSRASYPTNYDFPNVVSVASSDSRDQLSSFSNYGQTTVDLAAPGSSILSTTPGNNYKTFSGTSMASPYVAGVAALVKGQYPGLDVISLKYRVLGSVDPKGAFNTRTSTGGRLNAANALSTSPLITLPKLLDTNNTTTPYRISAYVVDDGTINQPILHYTLSGSGTGTGTVPMNGNGPQYTGDIPAQALETTVSYYVEAADNDGNSVQSRTTSFLVTASPEPPGGTPCCGAMALTINTGNQHSDAAASLGINFMLVLAGFWGLRWFLRRR